MNKKEFALSQIAPYYKDPSICGYDPEENTCEYLTKDGKMCVFGKNLIDPESVVNASAGDLLEDGEGILKPESQGILTPNEWTFLQWVHDGIARGRDFAWEGGLEPLFTQEELEEYCNEING